MHPVNQGIAISGEAMQEKRAGFGFVQMNSQIQMIVPWMEYVSARMKPLVQRIFSRLGLAAAEHHE